jgi:hypothetical protein
MNVEEALRVADAAVVAKTKEHLTDIQRFILRGAWQSQTYDEIAEACYREPQHIKNVGAEFWRLLSEALGEKVTKTKFRSALERRSHSATVPQPQEPAQEETPSKNTDFVGREEAINDLDNFVNEGAKVILIQAEGGVGKTTLAQKWFEHQGLEPLLLRVGMTSQNIQSAEDWVRHKLLNDFQENPERNFLTMLEQLRVKLQTQRIGVLIDNLEPALINGEFIEPHQSYYVELLTVLAHPTVQSITLVTSREPLYEPGIIGFQTFHTYLLEELKKKAWEKYFDSQNISRNINALSETHRAYGGNALAMHLLSSDIRKESQGNLEVYWQQNHNDLLRHRSIENLIQRQLNKLSEDDPKAHELLCRLGCYPNQDIPSLPKVWLFCLVWDVPEKRRQRVIDALCDRSLLKVSDDRYYLHPVIRAEAVDRLKLKDSNPTRLLLIKREIDALEARNERLQKFLRWISKKSAVPNCQKPAAARFFYFKLALLACNLTVDFTPIRIHASELELDLNFDVSSALNVDVAIGFILTLANDPALGIDQSLRQALQQLKNQLPNPIEHKESDPFSCITRLVSWWRSEGQHWSVQLRAVMIEHHIIDSDWQLSGEQIEVLKHYEDVNNLLVDCLNNACNVTEELEKETMKTDVGKKIMKTLLLPSAEIEKLTPRD